MNYDQGNISKACVTGNFGNHFYLLNWFEAQKIKLHKYKSTQMILLKKDKFSNPELFKYFQDKIKLIYEDDLSNKEKKIKRLTNIPLEYAIPIKNSLIQIHIATI